MFSQVNDAIFSPKFSAFFKFPKLTPVSKVTPKAKGQLPSEHLLVQIQQQKQ